MAFGRIQCQRSKESSSRGKGKRGVQKDSKNQSEKHDHLNEFSENGRKGDARWSERLEREGQIEELVGDKNPCP